MRRGWPDDSSKAAMWTMRKTAVYLVHAHLCSSTTFFGPSYSQSTLAHSVQRRAKQSTLRSDGESEVRDAIAHALRHSHIATHAQEPRSSAIRGSIICIRALSFAFLKCPPCSPLHLRRTGILRVRFISRSHATKTAIPFAVHPPKRGSLHHHSTRLRLAL